MKHTSGSPIVSVPGGGCVFHPAFMKTIDRGNGIESVPLVTPASGAEHLSTGYTLIPPGIEIPWHTHNVEESVVVLDGEGICEAGDHAYPVGPLDVTLMSAGMPHRFRNSGTVTLRILWIYPSTTATRTLLESGDVMNHLDPYSADSVGKTRDGEQDRGSK